MALADGSAGSLSAAANHLSASAICASEGVAALRISPSNHFCSARRRTTDASSIASRAASVWRDDQIPYSLRSKSKRGASKAASTEHRGLHPEDSPGNPVFALVVAAARWASHLRAGSPGRRSAMTQTANAPAISRCQLVAEHPVMLVNGRAVGRGPTPIWDSRPRESGRCAAWLHRA